MSGNIHPTGIYELEVRYEGRKVGRLAQAADHRIAFAYDPEWIRTGFSLNPLSLPLRSRVFLPKSYDPFDGLFGVFADSLPDGWGHLIVDRWLSKNGFQPETVSSLGRLAIVGNDGSGALTYHPNLNLDLQDQNFDLERLAAEAEKLFETNTSDDLDELLLKAGSSGGARPKAFFQADNSEWIVKFPCSMDPKNMAVQEYEYSQCAGRCGIEVPETRLFATPSGKNFFGTKRFDRQDGKKVHMVSVSGLLETSHRIPNLDYSLLLKLTRILTKDAKEEEKMFRLMCFNVFAHNRDDHSKNFSFLYNTDTKQWKLSPAYDLTYSSSYGGEHATTVHGNGKNPGKKEILQLAEEFGFNMQKSKSIMESIKNQVEKDLGKYLKT